MSGRQWSGNLQAGLDITQKKIPEGFYVKNVKISFFRALGFTDNEAGNLGGSIVFSSPKEAKLFTYSYSSLLEARSWRFSTLHSPLVLQAPNKPQPMKYFRKKKNKRKLIESNQQNTHVLGGMFTMLIGISGTYHMQSSVLDTGESNPHLNSVLQWQKTPKPISFLFFKSRKRKTRWFFPFGYFVFPSFMALGVWSCSLLV